MTRFVLSLYSELDQKSAIGVFDSEHGLKYLQVEDLSTSLSLPQLRGLCVVGNRLYITTPSSLRIYAIADDHEPRQPWFSLVTEVILPEWALGARPNAGLLPIHYSTRKNCLLIACNALACVYEFDLNGELLARRHLWEISPGYFHIPVQPGGKGGFGQIRGICEDSSGRLLLTVAFRNWTDKGSVIDYESGDLLLDGLETPHSGLFIKDHFYVLDVRRGALIGIPLGVNEPQLRVKATTQSFASRGLKVNLRGLAGDESALYAGFFNSEKDENQKVASHIVRFDPVRGVQQQLTLLPEVKGFRYPAPFYIASFPADVGPTDDRTLILFDATRPPEIGTDTLSTPATTPVQPLVATEAVTAPPEPIRPQKQDKTPQPLKPVLEVNNASLSYRRSGRLFSWLKRQATGDFKALSNVSLTLHEGEVLGLVGRNGSGKSTMGMLLAGIMQPDAGDVKRHGRVQLLSLGVGFDNELSGRDNVFVNAALLGLSRRQVREHLDEIIEFSEIGEFIDEPIRTYSAGMRSRLAFAIATVIQPDILILDEVLSTGDDSFRRKAEARMRGMRDKAKSVVMVSHSANQIKKLCSRVIWLERGHLVLDGKPKQVMPEYEAFCQNPDKWIERHPHIVARLDE